MNACLIAACAVNARSHKKEQPASIPTHELYYKVTLKTYYNFKQMIWSSPIYYNEHADIYSMRTTTIDAKTYATAIRFSVKESLCPNGVDEYIKSTINSITSTAEWKARHIHVLLDYCAEIKKQYNIILDPTDVNYTNEYYWEVK